MVSAGRHSELQALVFGLEINTVQTQGHGHVRIWALTAKLELLGTTIGSCQSTLS